MRKTERWRVLLVALALTLVAVAVPTGMALAATEQEVTITAQPSYITISNSPDTWTTNGIVNDGYIAVDTIYYANTNAGGRTDTTVPQSTVVDDDCRFTVDPTGSSANVDLSVNCGNFTNSLMDNSGTGANGATTYGGYSYYSGGSNAGVIMKETGSSTLKTNQDKDTALKWGAWIETRTNAWSSGTSSTATMTISAVETS